jgi:hypothetical protein
MFKNVQGGIFTSVIGACIIGGAIVSVFLGKANWTEASVGMAVGVGLLVVPDPKLKKSE